MSGLRGIEKRYFAGGNSPTPIGKLPASLRYRGRRTSAARTRITCLMAIGAAVLCTPLRARGATVIATITGTVTSGKDYTGVFVALGGNLAGYSYTLVYTMNDTEGVPIYGTWPADCDNGLQSSGLNTPVPQAVLTINGKSYTFGTHTPSSVSSWVYSGNATVPQTTLAFALRDFFDGSTGIGGPYGTQATEEISGSVNLDSLYSCRDWESPFNYTLQPEDLSGSYFQFEVDLWTTDNFGSPFAEFGEGYLSVQTVSVSGPIGGPPPALSLVSPFLLGASDLSNLDLATLLPKLPSLASAEAAGLVADGTSAAIALWATNTREDVTFTSNNGTTLLPYAPNFLTYGPSSNCCVASAEAETTSTEGNASLTIPAANLITIGSVLYAAALVQAPPPGISASFSDPIIVTAKQGAQAGGVSMSLVPPPVVLVHGIWGDKRSLENVQSYLLATSPWKTSGLVEAICYSKYLAFDATTDPITSSDPCEQTSEDALQTEIKSLMAPLTGTLDSKHIVGGRVDLVAHSMGGLAARNYSASSEYGSLRNRNQGAFHEIVTLDTPEEGSALATYLYGRASETLHMPKGSTPYALWTKVGCSASDNVETCFAKLGSGMPLTAPGQPLEKGAVYSLTPAYLLDKNIPSPKIPNTIWRAIAASWPDADKTQSLLRNFLNVMIAATYGPKQTPETTSGILETPDNDVVVTEASQTADFATAGAVFKDLAHTTLPITNGQYYLYLCPVLGVCGSTQNVEMNATVNALTACWLSKQGSNSCTQQAADVGDQPSFPLLKPAPPHVSLLRKWAEESTKFIADDRMSIALPAGPVRLNTPFELPVHVMPEGLLELAVDDGDKSPLTGTASITRREGSTVYIKLTPVRLGRYSLDIGALYADGGNTVQMVTLDVQPPSGPPKSFTINGGRTEMQLSLNAPDKVNHPIIEFHPEAIYPALKDKIDLDPSPGYSFVTYTVLPGNDDPGITVQPNGYVYAVRPGEATIEAHFGAVVDRVKIIVLEHQP
jgi:hypothetical protein